MKRRFADEQIIGFFKEAEAETTVKDLYRSLGGGLLRVAQQV